jgi:hypothetical protein
VTDPQRERPLQWHALDPTKGTALVDARRQVHHAAQLATALGISYLPARPDDSHTNLEWIERIGALASNAIGSPAVRIAVRPFPFAMLVLDASANVVASYPLDGRTIDDATAWIRRQLADRGLDSTRYTLKRHYEIPSHPVDTGAAFRATTPELFEQLGAWYSIGADALGRVVSAATNASVVRCWPHHFDIATLLEVAPGKTISLGMEPGDGYWAEPYFYASMYPVPNAQLARPELGGDGVWNTRDWIGPVLPSSRMGATFQPAQVDEFIQSAVSECTRMLGG